MQPEEEKSYGGYEMLRRMKRLFGGRKVTADMSHCYGGYERFGFSLTDANLVTQCGATDVNWETLCGATDTNWVT